MDLRLRFKKGGATNYPYAVARVQAKRSKLLPQADYAKFLEMDVSEITRFLEDSSYKAEVDELAARFAGLDLLENAVTVNAERTYRSVRGLVAGGGGAIVGQFLARFLLDDVKAVIRGKTAGATREEMLQELLVEDLDTYNILDPLLADDVRTVEDIRDTLARIGGAGTGVAAVLASVPDGSPQSAYEDALDQSYFSALRKVLAESKEPGAKAMATMVAREIDVRNATNAARWVASGQGGDFAHLVIPGGRLLNQQDVLALSTSGDFGPFADLLRDKGFREEVVEAAAAMTSGARLSRFQAALWRDYLAHTDSLAGGNPLSLLPILAFLLRKQREVQVIRAVARGKAAGLSRERLEELLP